jgi:polar amino acid transport system permease protein
LPPPFDLLPSLLEGLVVTLKLTVGGAGVALLCSFAAGLGRMAPWWVLRFPATSYVEIFRGTSALVQLFWFYFVLPFFGVNMDAMTAGILVLGLNTGAYGAEVVRGAIHAVPMGQKEAAVALNFSPFQRMRRVIVPQALVAMIPPAGNLLIELLKNTALVSLITLSELTFAAQTLRADTLRTTEIFGLVLLLYFAVALFLTFCMRQLERYLGHGRDLGGLRQ